MIKTALNIIGKAMAAAGGILTVLGAMAADLNPIEVVMKLLIVGIVLGTTGAIIMQKTGSKVFYE